MKFTVGQIKKSAHDKPFAFDGEVDVSELESMNNDIRNIKPVHVRGKCTLQGEQIIFSFVIDGEMTLPCARTLVDVEYPFEIEADEVFSTSSDYYDAEESEIHPVYGEVLDLTPYIKENILLGVPYRVFSDDADVQTLQKGNGWEIVSEEAMEKSIDPRLKKLESLLKDYEKEK